MAIKTPFNQTAFTPPPFNIGNIPAPNITAIPHFMQTGFINGTAPSAHPAIGLQPVTLKTLLSGILPKKSG